MLFGQFSGPIQMILSSVADSKPLFSGDQSIKCGVQLRLLGKLNCKGFFKNMLVNLWTLVNWEAANSGWHAPHTEHPAFYLITKVGTRFVYQKIE